MPEVSLAARIAVSTRASTIIPATGTSAAPAAPERRPTASASAAPIRAGVPSDFMPGRIFDLWLRNSETR